MPTRRERFAATFLVDLGVRAQFGFSSKPLLTETLARRRPFRRHRLTIADGSLTGFCFPQIP